MLSQFCGSITSIDVPSGDFLLFEIRRRSLDGNRCCVADGRGREEVEENSKTTTNNVVNMTQNKLDVLKQIVNGKSNWGPEYESVLDSLARDGDIEIIKKHPVSTGGGGIDLILVRATEKGRAKVQG